MRAYELMVIVNGSVEEAEVRPVLDRVRELVVARGGDIVKVDNWGRRRFAYEIDHKWDGWYSVFEFRSEGEGLEELERSLRLADDIVRHKLMRLPDREAARRGLLEAATPATAG